MPSTRGRRRSPALRHNGTDSVIHDEHSPNIKAPPRGYNQSRRRGSEEVGCLGAWPRLEKESVRIDGVSYTHHNKAMYHSTLFLAHWALSSGRYGGVKFLESQRLQLVFLCLIAHSRHLSSPSCIFPISISSPSPPFPSDLVHQRRYKI